MTLRTNKERLEKDQRMFQTSATFASRVTLMQSMTVAMGAFATLAQSIFGKMLNTARFAVLYQLLFLLRNSFQLIGFEGIADKRGSSSHARWKKEEPLHCGSHCQEIA